MVFWYQMGFFMNVDEQLLNQLINAALKEDLGQRGDVTSDAVFSDGEQADAVIRSKGEGVCSGIYLLKPLFTKINDSLEIEIKAADGDRIGPGTVLCTLKGPVKAILAGERVALNFLQRLSGIATLTSKYVGAISHTTTRLLDTRKTTPMLRYLEKLAVVHGGGCNHRFGLFDMILIKDTHVKRSGGVGNALTNAQKFRGNDTSLKIEVEVQSIAELEEALRYNPDRIMLDNMSIVDMKNSVGIVKKSGKKVELEASGNVTLSTITVVAETGVDFISCGSITHSAPSMDIHLLIV
jgi:nicotinate-nucleotide pyrophosphorylase (carboxylating)